MAKDFTPPASGYHARYVTIKLASVLTGLTDRAIESKIHEGKWVEGREYRRGPDGRVYIDMDGVTRWVERATA